MRRVILVADMVDSVRLMKRAERATIAAWQGFVDEVRTALLPQTQGRLVKSLGDGLLLEFESAHHAVEAALQLHGRLAHYNEGRASDDALRLRIGAHASEVVVDVLDVYGHGVNLAARLAGSAGPGETVVSQELRDELVPGLDADIEDLGERYLKGLDAPVRCFRVGPAGAPVAMHEPAPSAAAPGIAVLPMMQRSGARDDRVWGQLIADEIIAGLSRAWTLRVISRQSTAALQGRKAALDTLGKLLGVRYVLSGSFLVEGSRVVVFAELAETDSQSVLVSERMSFPARRLAAGAPEVLAELLSTVTAAIVVHEVRRVESRSMPNLDAYSLMLVALTCMHQVASQARFQIAHDALTQLIERHPRLGLPYAWLGKWHVMRVIQSWTDDPQREALQAQRQVRMALDRDPSNALALTIDGQIQGFFFKDLATAERRHREALDANPNEALAWLYRANVCGWKGEGEAAHAAARHGLGLSPLDPLRFYYDTLAAAAALAAGRFDEAVTTAQRSLRVNRTHTATYRVLAIAQVLAGQGSGARQTVERLLRLEPSLTVASYLARYPGAELPHGRIYGQALLDAGVPSGA